MKTHPFSKILPPFGKFLKVLTVEVWVFLGLTLLSVFFLSTYLNLTPEVDDNFFFSSEDPQFQSEHKIDELFIRQDAQLVISASGDIHSEVYQKKIFDLSEMLIHLESVSSVISLTHYGPADLKDALTSPLWKRTIISDDKKSTNLIVLIDMANSEILIPKIENVLSVFEADDFHLRAAGLPYVIELIKRNLTRDLRIFSILAFLIFGFFIFNVFRSRGVLTGTLISCLNACMWTLMITYLLNIPMGLLTANLGTVIFVLTLSHIIFLTYNWKELHRKKPDETDHVAQALRITFPASFWSMITTLLGFLSLLSVPAKPLRDLGLAGAIGTVIAIIVAYGVFPSFLRMARPHLDQNTFATYQTHVFQFINKRKKSLTLIILVMCVLALPGLTMVDSDPSLLSYFSKKSEIYQGFSYIDRNGGSSPLVLVVRSKLDEKLNTGAAYKKLWDLQESLEQHRSVGSVISLPVLIAQAKKTSIGFLLSNELLLGIMESPQFDQVTKSFITEDRKYGLFLLRMTEGYRTLDRVEIVEEMKDIAEAQGFVPEIVGGVYNLQGHLAKLVASSLVFGLGKLIVIFGIIAWIISRSLRIALAMTLSIFLIPLSVLGLIGLYRIPLDIISAPASNVAIAMGIDSMIHMINSYRRLKDWNKVIEVLWQPILTSMLVVSMGFAIFLVSQFPPTQRFGLSIVFGTLLASLTALYIMPLFFKHLKLNDSVT